MTQRKDFQRLITKLLVDKEFRNSCKVNFEKALSDSEINVTKTELNLLKNLNLAASADQGASGKSQPSSARPLCVLRDWWELSLPAAHAPSGGALLV